MAKKEIKKIIAIMIFLGLSLAFFVVPSKAQNNDLDLTEEEQAEIEEKEGKVEELEEKARQYREIINLKQHQQSTIGNQINSLNNEVAELEKNIKETERKIEDLNNQVEDVRSKIKKKEKAIEIQKKLLARLIRTYYEYQQQDVFSIIFGSSGLSDFMVEKDRVSQIGERVKTVLASLKSLKTSLENERKSIENKKGRVVESKSELEEKNYYLEVTRIQKTSLLSQTQGEEARYQNLLKRIEQQKQEILGDLDSLYAANSAEINSLLDSLPRPTSGLASRSWYYSQKDSRWGNDTIGQSNSLMKDYGCAISAVAMVYTFYGKNITPGKLSKQPIFYWDLIKWPSTWQGINLVTNTYHSGVNWKTVDRELENGYPVIVYIRAGRGGGHYVVIHHKDDNGKYVVHDPYFGANIYLESSMKLLSRLYSVSISDRSIDQMILYK